VKKKSYGRYKNGLEKYCGDSLQKEGYTFEYEAQFTLVEGFTYPSTYFKSMPKKKTLIDVTGKKILPIKYRPDFYLPKEKVFIETKGFVRANDSFPLRWKLFMVFLMNSNMADHSLFIPKNRKQVDEIIKHLSDEP
jgi:hypothetical protein